VSDVPTGGQVALKLLHDRLLGDADARSRFVREGRVGRSLRHPAVVATLGEGVAESPDASGEQRPWIAMELVEGRTLRDLIHELGRVPEPLLRDVALQVALALDAIHQAGIVHRDLKPSNLIITPEQQVRVMDLGIAVDLADEARLTQAGMFVGTLLYASPEPFGRHPKRVDAASSGSGRIVVVEGEAGVGKSRLLDALGDLVLAGQDDVVLLRSARAPGEAGLGATSLGQALLDHFGLPELKRQVADLLAATPRLASGFLAHVLAEPPPPEKRPCRSRASLRRSAPWRVG
jgi:serine/threonine protein kinase